MVQQTNSAEKSATRKYIRDSELRGFGFLGRSVGFGICQEQVPTTSTCSNERSYERGVEREGETQFISTPSDQDQRQLWLESTTSVCMDVSLQSSVFMYCTSMDTVASLHTTYYALFKYLRNIEIHVRGFQKCGH